MKVRARDLTLLLWAFLLVFGWQTTLASDSTPTLTITFVEGPIITPTPPDLAGRQMIVITQEDLEPFQQDSARKNLAEINAQIAVVWKTPDQASTDAVYAFEYGKLAGLIQYASIDQKNFNEIVLPEMKLLPPLPSSKAKVALRTLLRERGAELAAIELEARRVEIESAFRERELTAEKEKLPQKEEELLNQKKIIEQNEKTIREMKQQADLMR